jgi:S-formylglutathione hydrolase FrmB
MPSSSLKRRAQRLGVLVSAAALTAGLAPFGIAEAAVTFKAADDGAKITSSKWLGKYEFDFTVKSPALGSSRKVRVLVPKSWAFTSKKTWPILYAFHGGNDSYVSWTRSTDIESYAIKYNAIVVMPEGANGSYTDWWNGGKRGTPKWETFHTVEVKQLMERNYHSSTVRAAMGLSSGGQGAMTYAGRHPGMFKYAASFSGVLSMNSPGIPALLMYINMNKGYDPANIWGVPYVDYANWNAHDPRALLPKMRGTKLYVSSGTTGQKGPLDKAGPAAWSVAYLSEGAVGMTDLDFLARAKELNIPVASHLYGDGSHSWPYWAREMHSQWATIMKTIGAKKV